ncbi:cdc42 effector protein 2 [Thalassophryne amazonica]|uniref:cdc42 effector protein 2 n=1 Tax=Thalassophryne amazonica TaxID=390379 RepID=UPI001471F261|nr:cdc42 effector protein 2 [Thalassophryne amazonica]
MSMRTSLHRKHQSARWPSRDAKHRDILSVDMISLPLADFRHITHIGNDANTDSFGDLSILKKGHSLLLQSFQSEQNVFLSCSPPPKPPRLKLDETEPSKGPNWTVSPQRSTSCRTTNCTSMPLLDNKGGKKDMEKEVAGHRGDPAGSLQSPTNGTLSSGMNGESTVTPDKIDGHQDEDTCFSFSLDLGPSILDDVLQVMDKLHY